MGEWLSTTKWLLTPAMLDLEGRVLVHDSACRVDSGVRMNRHVFVSSTTNCELEFYRGLKII